MPFVPITCKALRAAMRDPRYWQAGRPERQPFGSWVTQGFQALEGSALRDGEGRTMVFVRAYTRVRDGRTEHVGAHVRSNGARGDHVGESKAPIGNPKAPPPEPPGGPVAR